MPDPEVFAQCVRDSFQELLAAALAKKESPQRRRMRAATPPPPRTAPKRVRIRASAGDRPRPTTPSA